MDVHWVLLVTSSVRTSNQLRAAPEEIKSVAIMSVIISQNRKGNFLWTKIDRVTAFLGTISAAIKIKSRLKEHISLHQNY